MMRSNMFDLILGAIILWSPVILPMTFPEIAVGIGLVLIGYFVLGDLKR